MTSVIQRLRERKLFQWALAYLAGAWIVFQGIEVMAEPWDLSPAFQRTVHLLVGVGFLVALVLAWYHGEQGRQRVSGTELLIIALLLAVGALLIRVYRPEEAAVPGTRGTETAERAADGAVRSLAVLPLENLMGDPEQAYFVDGLHDVLIGELAGISELRVISRTSVMRYRDTEHSMGEIAAELDVDALIEGSVFRSGDTVRITVQLIRGAPEEHLWQERYEGRLSEALGLQTRVAEAIAGEIRLALSPHEAERLARRTEVDPAAQEAYMRGRALWRTRLPDVMGRALAYLEEAVAADPTFALAWSGLADVYTMGSFYGGLDVTADEAQRRAERSARRALELDPDLAEAHVALAGTRYWGAWDVDTGERELLRALELNPNLAQAHNWLGDVLNARGNAEEALPSFRRARDLDPFSPLMNRDLARSLFYLGRCEEAIAAARYAVELDPGHAEAHRVLRECYRLDGRVDEAAEAAARRFESIGPASAAAGVRAAYESGGWESLLEFEIEYHRSVPSHYHVAVKEAELGRADEALEALFAAIEARQSRVLTFKVEPVLRSLHSDPRWEEVVRRAGF
ncbi:MAG: tetratricopeptide repeat protein [Gemmatimonadetes bacterium]|nr:tetratricopeptide repeat protein [Gemmatimonadota bacterium]NIO30907.1 tetratricopeptide repeat protein [Gemmatimonadota bacterium]